MNMPWAFVKNQRVPKVCSISEGILTLVPLPTKCAKSHPWAENLNKLFTEKSGKFEFSAQGQEDLATFVGNVTKVFWDKATFNS